jgi:hypothetical protein
MGKWSRPQSAIGIIGHVLTFGIRNALAPAHRVIALKSRPSGRRTRLENGCHNRRRVKSLPDEVSRSEATKLTAARSGSIALSTAADQCGTIDPRCVGQTGLGYFSRVTLGHPLRQTGSSLTISRPTGGFGLR